MRAEMNYNKLYVLVMIIKYAYHTGPWTLFLIANRDSFP